MRRSLIAASLTALALLVACQMTGTATSPVTSDEILVTPLDPPSEPGTAVAGGTEIAPAGADDPHPKPKPADLVAPTTPDEGSDASKPALTEAGAPETPKAPEQILCEASGGLWSLAGKTGAYICVSPTRDGGKSCRKKTDCEGQCLARSGTCAPYSPLFGCNEVLEKDGRRVTLCID